MPVQEKSGSVHERILEKACELFYAQGYRGTGINQIISESGVAKASFYDHFPSKSDLLLAYVQRMSDREVDELAADVRKLPTPEERFVAPFRLLEPWFEDTGYRGCPFSNVIAELPTDDDAIRDAVRMHRDKERMFFRELTEEYVAARPELKGVDCIAVADTFLLLFEGAIATCTAMRELWPAKKAEESLLEYINNLAPN